MNPVQPISPPHTRPALGALSFRCQLVSLARRRYAVLKDEASMERVSADALKPLLSPRL